MKKISILLILMVIAAGSSFALDDPLFAPVLPEIIGQGGAFTANAHGYGALVTNPAGFSMKNGSFTLLSMNLGPYFLPTEQAMTGIQAFMDGKPEDGITDLSDIITTNGVGTNMNVGIGIVGKGLGLGLIIDGDIYGSGKTAFGSAFDGALTATGIAGLSLKLGTDTFGINIGGDIKLMHRIKMEDIAVVDLLADDPSFNVYTGNAIGLDLGAIMQLGTLSFGLSLRDIGGTQFMYQIQDINSDSFDPMAAGDDKSYKIPMQATAGVSYHPDFGGLRFIIDPVFNFDYQKIFYSEEENETSFWTGVHAGTEVKVLRFMKVRAGINQGYVTAGIGAKLLFFDLNASYFTREMGRFAGSQPNSGFTMEAALRF